MHLTRNVFFDPSQRRERLEAFSPTCEGAATVEGRDKHSVAPYLEHEEVAGCVYQSISYTKRGGWGEEVGVVLEVVKPKH